MIGIMLVVFVLVAMIAQIELDPFLRAAWAIYETGLDLPPAAAATKQRLLHLWSLQGFHLLHNILQGMALQISRKTDFLGVQFMVVIVAVALETGGT